VGLADAARLAPCARSLYYYDNRILGTGHDLMITEPQAVAELLLQLAHDRP
jgi:hypothetical protein